MLSLNFWDLLFSVLFHRDDPGLKLFHWNFLDFLGGCWLRCMIVFFLARAFLNTVTMNKFGGNTMAVVTTLMNSWWRVNENGPMETALTFSTFSSDLKNMQFVIMVRNNNDTQQLTRCTLVKLLFVGLDTTENHRWSFVNFLRTEDEKRWLKAVRSFIPATGSIRSTAPSSSSTASHRLQRKKNLTTTTTERHTSA